MQETAMMCKDRRELVSECISKNDTVLDVGFWGQAHTPFLRSRDTRSNKVGTNGEKVCGQAVEIENPEWLHGVLLREAGEVYGVDLFYEEAKLKNPDHYKKQSAEDFLFGRTFDVVFASELIEHLSNPGLFLGCAKKHLKEDGRLILTTPNTFNFFNLIQKVIHDEPPVNSDHTMYFSKTVLEKLLAKNGFEVREVGYIKTFPNTKSLKRKVLFALYTFLFLFTPKFAEGFFIVATPRS